MDNNLIMDNSNTISDTKVKNMDNDDLVDIRDIKINTSLSKNKRVEQYIKQIKNPCKFKCGKLTVQIEYAKNGVSLEDKLIEYVRAM